MVEDFRGFESLVKDCRGFVSPARDFRGLWSLVEDFRGLQSLVEDFSEDFESPGEDLIGTGSASQSVGLAGASQTRWYIPANRVVMVSIVVRPRAVGFTWESRQFSLLHFPVTMRRTHMGFCSPDVS